MLGDSNTGRHPLKHDRHNNAACEEKMRSIWHLTKEFAY
jgi:hypothetical protein